MRESFHERSVQVLYDPDGSGIKIAAEPVWLRYQWDYILTMAVWFIVFGGGLSIARRRLRILEHQPDDMVLPVIPKS